MFLNTLAIQARTQGEFVLSMRMIKSNLTQTHSNISNVLALCLLWNCVAYDGTAEVGVSE